MTTQRIRQVACSCLNVRFNPIINSNGTHSERWQCVNCKTEFTKTPKPAEAPKPTEKEERQQEIEKWVKMMDRRAANFRDIAKQHSASPETIKKYLEDHGMASSSKMELLYDVAPRSPGALLRADGVRYNKAESNGI